MLGDGRRVREGTPQEVVDARGLAVVSDDGALIAAIDEALASQPDVLEKIRDAKDREQKEGTPSAQRRPSRERGGSGLQATA